MNYELLISHVDERGVAEVILNRPDIHNAFNDQLIEEVIHVFGELEKDENVRLVVLSGKGQSFCAGADLNWMSSMINYSQEENVRDSLRLARMFEVINDFKKPIIGKINGHALGGGVGLVAVCDYAITHEKAKFGFTEVRLGLIPAVISPFCINKIGETNARAWFLSGERFDGHQGRHMGLIHEVTSLGEFEDRVNAIIASHLQAGPAAAVAAKSLIQNVLKLSKGDVTEFTCHEIAKKRVSAEGQEGMKALLNKTQPNWMK